MKTLSAQQLTWRMLRNGAAIFLGEGLSRLGNFVIAVIIARQFGAAALGQYGYAVSVASILLLLPDMGLHLTATQRVAARAEELPQIFWNLHWLKLAMLGAVALFAVFFGEFAMADAGRRLLFYILTIRVAFLTFSQSYMAFYKATEQMHFVTLQQAVGVTASLLAVLLCFWTGTTLAGFVGALVAGQLAEVCAGWWIIRKAFHPGPPQALNLPFAKNLLGLALPVGFIAVLQAATLRIDVLVLGAFASNSELGHFQAAAWLLVLAFLSASLLMTVLFPRLVRVLHSPSPGGTAWVESLVQNGVILSLAAATITCLTAPYLLRACYGNGLLPAAPHLRILSAVVPFLFLNTILFYIFVASDQRKTYLFALLLSAGAGLGLAFVLAPRFGGMGVGIADLARESLLSALLLMALRRRGLIPSLGPALLRAAGASALIMALIAIFAGVQHSSDAWAAAWVCSISACSLAFLGMPKRRQFLMLAREGG